MTKLQSPKPFVIWTEPGDDPNVRIVITTYEGSDETGACYIPCICIEYSDGSDLLGVTHWLAAYTPGFLSDGLAELTEIGYNIVRGMARAIVEDRKSLLPDWARGVVGEPYTRMPTHD